MQSTSGAFVVRSLGLGVLLAIAGGCASSAPVDSGYHGAPDDTGGVDGGATNDTGTPRPVDAAAHRDSGPWQSGCITLTFPTVTVPASGAGQEDTRCVVVDLGNDLPIHINSIHNVLGTASHHFIVYRDTPTATLNPTPTHCQPFVDTLSANAGSPLMITQRHDETLALPTGVAYTLPAHQPMRLELHYINLTGAPADAAPTATLCGIPDSAYTDEADFLFIGNPDVRVPAHSTATLGPTFYQLDSRFAGAHFFAITGHEHSLGTNVIVQTGSSRAGPFTDVYNVPGWSWSEPATVVESPPFTLPSGGGFNFTCTWNNPTSTDVRFGERASDEMCFFWAYYYPAHAGAPHVCAHTDQVNPAGGGFNICCPGNPLCSMISSRLGGP